MHAICIYSKSLDNNSCNHLYAFLCTVTYWVTELYPRPPHAVIEDIAKYSYELLVNLFSLRIIVFIRETEKKAKRQR